MERRIRVTVQADPKALEAVRGLVRGFARSWGLPSGRVDEIVLAVNEACANAIRHSYGSNPARSFVLAMGATDRFLEFELRDSGKPAPRDRVAPAAHKRPNRRNVRPGGLGVGLIYRVFDETVFEPGRTRGNRVVMRARRDNQTRAGQPRAGRPAGGRGGKRKRQDASS
ncbi:MAG TPA: ATP-binding protein [Candidatus Hydrogenedentes bacterium]|jgi:anti-sigma regulatory factor (Ser/Thr protein kinase)|nr:ATP-binding protein [Candidatus Hydrogenedentota bacterium]